jgi:hypothetical protein
MFAKFPKKSPRQQHLFLNKHALPCFITSLTLLGVNEPHHYYAALGKKDHGMS